MGIKASSHEGETRPDLATLNIGRGLAVPKLFPFLSLSSYYNFISTTMIVLFVVGLVVVFVYEYEMLRRSKT